MHMELEMKETERLLLSGNEAVAYAACHAGVALGTGYPGTPSTEILEHFSNIGGKAQWAPNEKVALEVAMGVAFAGARTLVTMKHVGVNVAADPLFTAAYTGVTGGLVLISADDPGMASSQNEQDNRNYAQAAAIPMLEPSDSQEAYDFILEGFEISEKRKVPVILRMTTRICHSKTIVNTREEALDTSTPTYERDIYGRVMIPAYARPAHKKLRKKIEEIRAWNETSQINVLEDGKKTLGIITSGISYIHSKEAAPDACFLKLGMTYPLPIEKIKTFARSVDKCVVIEEGDPYLATLIRASGIDVTDKAEMYRFGELNVERIRRILHSDTSEEAVPPKGKPPELCMGCPHRVVFKVLSEHGCIVAGDIGCYTLGALPPFEAMDTCVCMGASITVGLGMRHVLSDEQARRVVSVIGDSTFMHSGLSGLTEMIYNPPKTGHVVCILDNATTAMTGLQEHPGTGRSLNHEPANMIVFEDVIKAMGIENVHVLEGSKGLADFEAKLVESVEKEELTVIIVRRPCILASAKIKGYEKTLEKNNG